jgi:hypothetical protein
LNFHQKDLVLESITKKHLMKKLIFVLTLLFAFTINVNAQETKISVEDTARKEAGLLAETVGLSTSQTNDFYRLFEMKYRTLEDKSLSVERKKEFLNIVMMKVQATLTEVQMKKLEGNAELLDRIRNGVKSK